MSKDGFFGNIFDSPDDDPLLKSDADRNDPVADDFAPPSWMDDADRDVDSSDEVPVEMQEVEVTPNDGTDSLEIINEAIDHGWRLAHITLTETETAAASGDAPQRFIVTIERDIPRSLFDFDSNP